MSPLDAGRLVGHIPASERRSPTTGLPILSTEPLTAAERDMLRRLDRALRLAADRVAEAIERGRVEHGLEALQIIDSVSITARQTAVALGSRR